MITNTFPNETRVKLVKPTSSNYGALGTVKSSDGYYYRVLLDNGEWGTYTANHLSAAHEVSGIKPVYRLKGTALNGKVRTWDINADDITDATAKAKDLVDIVTFFTFNARFELVESTEKVTRL